MQTVFFLSVFSFFISSAVWLQQLPLAETQLESTPLQLQADAWLIPPSSTAIVFEAQTQPDHLNPAD